MTEGYIAPIARLAEQFRKLPGVGQKTALRYAYAVLNLSPEVTADFADAILGAKRDVFTCPKCKGLSEADGLCPICSDPDRDPGTVCVLENARDVVTMEKVRGYRGTYHVLGGVLSPLDGITPDKLSIADLVARVQNDGVREVILATGATPGGDTTAAYIARILEPSGVKVSRLAYGIPVGGDIEYADEVTLFRAMEGRQSISRE